MNRLTALFLAAAVVTIGVVGSPLGIANSVHASVVDPGGGGGAGKSCLLPDGGTGAIQNDGQTCCPSQVNGRTTDPDKECLFAKYINPAIQLMSAVIGIVIVVGIILGAIEYITSAGDPQKAANGKKRITEALIGLAAFILLYTFLQFIIPGGLAHG